MARFVVKKNCDLLFSRPSADFWKGSYKQTPLSTSDLSAQTDSKPRSPIHSGAIRWETLAVQMLLSPALLPSSSVTPVVWLSST